MDSNDLDFSFNMEGFDRKALLAQAAEELNKLSSHLGDTESGLTPSETPEAAMMHALMNDDIKFGAFPIVYKITDKDFLARNRDVPFRFEELTKDYNFYWVRLPIILHPQENWAYNRLKVAIKLISVDAPAHAQPKTYQILPEKKFQDLINASGSLAISIDPNFQFNAQIRPQNVDVGVAEWNIGGGIDAKIKSGAGLVLGPFVYRIKKAIINHTSTGMEEVVWKIDSEEFFQDCDLQMVVIVQVPKATKKVMMVAGMEAYRYFTFAPSRLQEVIEQLSNKVRDFFMGGAKVKPSPVSWDLTPLLKNVDSKKRKHSAGGGIHGEH